MSLMYGPGSRSRFLRLIVLWSNWEKPLSWWQRCWGMKKRKWFIPWGTRLGGVICEGNLWLFMTAFFSDKLTVDVFFFYAFFLQNVSFQTYLLRLKYWLNGIIQASHFISISKTCYFISFCWTFSIWISLKNHWYLYDFKWN